MIEIQSNNHTDDSNNAAINVSASMQRLYTQSLNEQLNINNKEVKTNEKDIEIVEFQMPFDLKKKSDYICQVCKRQAPENNGDLDSPLSQSSKKLPNIIIPTKNDALKRLNTSSSLLEDEYFGEDTQKKQEKRDKFINPDTFHRLRDHNVAWDTAVFFEFLWYHILNYMIIGPLINLVYWRKRILMRNLQFWGNTRAFYQQTGIFFGNMIIITLYFSLDHQNIFFVEILFTFLILILRAYVIACKYATLHPDKIKLYRDFNLDFSQTKMDYYVLNWVNQDSFTMYRETYNALQRNEIDAAMFYISFFVEPSEQIQAEIAQLNSEISQNHTYTTSKYQPDCLFETTTSKQYFGYSILGFIIRQFIKIKGRESQFRLALVIALMRTALPIVYRYIYRDKFRFSLIEIFQLVALSMNNLFGYLVKKVNMSEKKILPTIDICNPYSLKAWSILRRLMFDYGHQFQIRLQAVMAIYIFTVLVVSAILMLWVLKIYPLDNIYPIMCLFELIITFSTLMVVLFYGSLVNEVFPEFRNTLGDHRVLITDLLRMKRIYFEQGIVGETNFVIKKSVAKIKEDLNLKEGKYNEELVSDRLNQLLLSIDDCENELEQDLRNMPFTLYGITFNLALYQQLLVGVFTIAAGFIQVFLFMNKTISLSN